MLDLAELRAVLDGVVYKAGWTFEAYEDDYEGPHLRIVVEATPDARKPGTTDLGIVSAIPPMDSAERFLEWLLWRIGRVESHEVREWFTYRSERVVDPHTSR